MNDIKNECLRHYYGEPESPTQADNVVKYIRNVLADAVVNHCQHPTTESVVCNACLDAAFVVRNA
jgi:hypothetical protein